MDIKKTPKLKGKKIAIISYLTIVGLLIAYKMNVTKKSSFASYHIRQSLGIITAIVSIIFFIKITIIDEFIFFHARNL